jgi:hypothetical protein
MICDDLGDQDGRRIGQFFFRTNPILKSMAIPASTFLKELVSSFLDFFSRCFCCTRDILSPSS